MVKDIEMWRRGEWVLGEGYNAPENVKEFVASVVDKAILKMKEIKNV